jgi:hypothetical protein
MQLLCWFVFLLGAYPLWQAWQANRRTSLAQAVGWALAAWVAWGGLILVAIESGNTEVNPTASYLALALTGCAGVAVLGARRPGVGPWNFVLFGLLGVMLLPLAEQLVAQGPPPGTLRIVFLGATVAVGVLNYLPTNLALAVVLLGGACTLQILTLTGQQEGDPTLTWWLTALTPWAGLIRWRLRAGPASEFDAVWLDFRDRFGFFWGQRVREQFNAAACHAGWPVVLRWQGLRLKPGAALPEPEVQTRIVAALRALLKRFGEEKPEEETD